MNRALIATRLLNAPLLAWRPYVEVFASALADDLGIAPMATEEQMAAQHRPTRYSAIYPDKGGIAVVPIVGALLHRAGPSASSSGSQGYAGTQNLLMELAADPNVRGILLDIDTPGGEVGGVHELSDAIMEIGQTKPVWALANSLAASAGMWIAASASRFLAAPYARVGSVGVVTMHIDASKAVEKRGLAVTFVHAGKHKVAGNEFAPLDPETRERMQAMIDDTYGSFVTHVATRRNMTEDAVRATEAMVYTAKEALELGFVDGISTLGQALDEMSESLKSSNRFVNIQRNGTMDQAQIDAARNEGIATGRTEERARFAAILGHQSAQGKGALALELASTTDLSVEKCAGILGKASVETPPAPPAPPPEKSDAQKTGEALAALRNGSPQVPGAETENAKQERAKEIATLGTRYRRTAA